MVPRACPSVPHPPPSLRFKHPKTGAGRACRAPLRVAPRQPPPPPPTAPSGEPPGRGSARGAAGLDRRCPLPPDDARLSPPYCTWAHPTSRFPPTARVLTPPVTRTHIISSSRCPYPSPPPAYRSRSWSIPLPTHPLLHTHRPRATRRRRPQPPSLPPTCPTRAPAPCPAAHLPSPASAPPPSPAMRGNGSRRGGALQPVDGNAKVAAEVVGLKEELLTKTTVRFFLVHL